MLGPRSLDAGLRDVVCLGLRVPSAAATPEPRVVAGNPGPRHLPPGAEPGGDGAVRLDELEANKNVLTPRAGPPPTVAVSPSPFLFSPFTSQRLEESEPGAGAPT